MISWPSGGPVPWHVDVVAATGSTNADLVDAGHAGAADRSVLATAHQSAGRGRLDRVWEAPPGSNLLVSFLIRELPADVHQLTQRLALAASVAVEHSTGTRPQLKWPNDLLVDGAKLAGILAHAVDRSFVVIGIGINVGWAPDGAAHLGGVVHPLELLREILVAWDELPADISATYRARLDTVGREVRVELPTGVVEGRAIDVEPDGRLVVLDACAITHRIDTGDVIHLRPR